MKKSICIVFALMLIRCGNSLFGQNKEVMTLPRPMKTQQSAPGGTVVVDNIVLDARAKKHYTTQQISTMPTLKKLKVNNMYAESFILDPKNNYTSTCTNNLKDQVDVADYAIKRSKTARTTVVVNQQCNLSVILLSWDEVRAQEAVIEKEYNNQK